MARDGKLSVQSIINPYSNADQKEILGAIELKAGIDPRDFIRKMQHRARWSAQLEEKALKIAEPSVRERKCARIANYAAKLTETLEDLREDVREDDEDRDPNNLLPQPGLIARAGNELAQEGSPPPGTTWVSDEEWWRLRIEAEVENIEGELESIRLISSEWHVEALLANLKENLVWLNKCAKRAVENVKREKTKPGNREAEGLYICVLSLVGLYHKFSAREVHAYKDRYTNEARGNLIDFLEIALRPLGFRGNRMAILRLVEKTKNEPGRSW